MDQKNGMLAAFIGYVGWGLLPVFWKQISHVPAQEIMAHRMVWLLPVILLLLALRRQWGWLRDLRSRPKTIVPYVATAMLLGLNWFTYIWAVNNNHIVETSLGYFVSPLISVLLGLIFLQERLRPGQWVAIGVAAVGVLYLTVNYGRLPWVALSLALTFCIYGLIRKTTPLDAFEGMGAEATLMFAPALLFLLGLERAGTGSFGHGSALTSVLLALVGVATAVPMLLYNFGVQRITLTSIGILQYVAPTLQFLLGVLVYREPFTAMRLLGFSIIWGGLLLYTIEGVLIRRRTRLAIQARPTP